MESNYTDLTLIPKEKSGPYQINSKSTSFFTNIINKTALNSFNKWGGITFFLYFI